MEQEAEAHTHNITLLVTYVFHFFGPGIHKTKPLTLQSDERATFCFKLIAVCLYFVFTPQHENRVD